MSSLDKKADTYLDICQEFMIKEFGGTVILRREPDHKIMTARPASQDGSPVRCFEVSERVWMDMKEDLGTHVVIVHDGKVSVSYPYQYVEHEGMCFQVDHPREVAELFHLLIYPASCITTSEETAWSKRKLGDLADFHVLIPDGPVWRILDLANPPADAPWDFMPAVFLSMGKTFEAYKMAGRWSDIVKSLPEVADQIKEGYVVFPFPSVSVRSAVDHIMDGPDARQACLDLLLVPKYKEVSSLYLRELLEQDTEMDKAIMKAFLSATSLTMLGEKLETIEILMPTKYQHQIRVAAEHILIRERLRSITECLVNMKSSYSIQADRHWHLCHALFSSLMGECLGGPCRYRHK